MISPEDAAVVAAQLGRAPRGLRAVAHRCPCGLPDVVETAPRLPDGTPFPTLYYLTCPKAAAAMAVDAGGVRPLDVLPRRAHAPHPADRSQRGETRP